MANPFPVLTVKIKTYDPSKLSGQLLPDSNRDNIINQLKNATVWLPNLAYALKDGDEVTVVGRQAFNLYQLINQLNAGSTSTIETLYFGVEPDVLNFVFTSNLLFTSLSWTPNSIYRTYAEYKIDDGDWVVIRSFDKGTSSSTFDFTGIAQIGQTAYIRLRFGNGTDFFSSWNTQSVVLAVPPVENIVITGTEYPYVFDFSWTQNDNYYTYTEYKINDGAWVEYATAPPGISSGQADASTVMTLGDTLHIRLRFGDGVNYSAWSEESITPHALFVGTSIPNLNNFNYVLYGENPAPVLTLYDNNVVIDHPEYVVQFVGNANYSGRFNFSACVNITSIDIPSPRYVSGGVQVTGCANLIFCRARGSAAAVPAMDFTGCVNLAELKLPRIDLTDIDFLDTIPNKAMLIQLDLSTNPQLVTADLTDFTNLIFSSMSGCTALQSIILNSSELREIILNSCTALTTLDLSCSSIYNVINVSFCTTLQGITLSEGTTNDEIGLYSLRDCAFSGVSLDQFFNALGEGTGFKKKKGKGPTPPSIRIESNPGSLECDISIATNKGWAVFTG